MRIAVAGGTGVVGRHVVHAVHAVEESGHQAVVLARSRGVDLFLQRSTGRPRRGPSLQVVTSLSS